MNREDLKNYKYNQIWIRDQTEYIEKQKETINRLNSTLSDMPKRKQKSKRHWSGQFKQVNRFIRWNDENNNTRKRKTKKNNRTNK